MSDPIIKRYTIAGAVNEEIYTALRRAAEGRDTTSSRLCRRIVTDWLRKNGHLPKLGEK